MAKLQGTETEKNLLKAFAGESQARGRYTMFAKKAKEEGYEQIAAFFKETAQNEYHHAKIFFSFLEGGPLEITATYPAGKVGTTEENLKAAADGEKEEFIDIYPEMAEIAEKEGFPKIAAKFKLILKIEEDHHNRYTKLWNNIKAKKVFEKDQKEFWICRECGYVNEGNKASNACPTCLHPQSHFEIKQKNY